MNRTISYFNAIICMMLAILVFSPFSHALTIATWNLEWLTTNGDRRYPQSMRNEQDYSVLHSTLQQFSPDVLAFQEVDSIEAIRKVVGYDYQIFLSDRAKPYYRSKQFNLINQYTGFAIKNSYTVTSRQDLIVTPKSKLRFASHISLQHNNQPLELLSVHLKAGCAGRYNPSNHNCQRLKQQAKVINDWLQRRDRAGDAYIVLGDFNHNLAFNGDWLWDELKHGLSQIPFLATRNTEAKCKVRSKKHSNKTHQFHSLIDHILVSQTINSKQATLWLYPSDLVLRYQLSDHCPVILNIL